MSRNALSVAILLSVALFAACQPSAPDTNRNAATAVATPEPINTAAIEAEITRLENLWAAAAQKHDAAAVGKILADDLVMVYPDGSTGTKASELRDIETGAMSADAWDLADLKVTVLSADSAFITGRGIIKNGKMKIPDSSKPIDISGEYRFNDVYARRNGQWLAVYSQTTKIANPGAAPAPAPAASPAASPKASVASAPASSPVASPK
jgi:hypothetical protein